MDDWMIKQFGPIKERSCDKIIMKKLTRTEDFGKNLNEYWQIQMTDLLEIKAALEKLYPERQIGSVTIEAICITLKNLNYIEI